MPKKPIERGAMTLSLALDVIAYLRGLRGRVKVSRYVEGLIREAAKKDGPKPAPPWGVVNDDRVK